MKKLIIIINPEDLTTARPLLNTLEGKFILPNVYKLLIDQDADLIPVQAGIRYILAGIDFRTKEINVCEPSLN